MGKILKQYYRQLTRMGVVGTYPSDVQKSIIFVNQVALLLVVIAFPFMALFLSQRFVLLSLISLPFVVMFLVCLVLNKFGYHVFAQLGIVLGMAVPIYIYSSILGYQAGVQYAAFGLLAFVHGVFRNDQLILKIWATLVPIIVFYALVIFDINLFFRVNVTVDQLMQTYFMSTGLVFLILIGVTYFYASRSEKQKSQTKHLLSVYGFTDREAEILFKLLEGKKNKEIAEDLFIEEGTVKTHLIKIYRKSGVNSRLELATKFHGTY